MGGQNGVNSLVQWYKKGNTVLRKCLWWFVIIGLLASLPLAYVRHETESSAKQVEFVFDYRNLLDIADLRTNPEQFVQDQLKKMKQNGIHSLAVYEATLPELRESRRIEQFTSKEAATLTQTPVKPDENFTYILFKDADTQKQLEPMIKETFAAYNVQTKPWSFKNQPGLVIQMSQDEANLKPMDPDPITLKMLKDEGFNIVARLSNKRPFDEKKMDALLKDLSGYGVSRIVVDGESMPGYDSAKGGENKNNLETMAKLMNKYHMGTATVEIIVKEQPKDFDTIAKETNYNVVRLHSFSEKDSEKLMENVPYAKMKDNIQTVADRFVLAVKDRNIRMVFLHAKPVRNIDNGTIKDPLDNLYKTLTGKDGAIKRIEHDGFKMDKAHAFINNTFDGIGRTICSLLVLLGGVSLITLLVSYFFPWSALAVFVIGLIGALGLNVLSNHIYSMVMALGTAVSAPSLAVMVAIRSVRTGQVAKSKSAVGFAIWTLIKSTLISAIGILYVVALLNSIVYYLLLEQFRGVGLLHLLPIAIVALYLLFFSEDLSFRGKIDRMKGMLAFNINVLWVAVAAIAGVAAMYYLSRTGNEGQVSGIERTFRAFLENTIGVRPRNKEFLLAHPLFILGAYLAVRYKHAVYLFIVGVIGQLSIVDTFAHLHTPLMISGIRVGIGLVFGIIIGLILVGCCEIVLGSWKKWAPKLKD
ncbi:DUF5693 family protein [Paenibacillus larvae]|uniref:DUF5693 family protein n=1 Tax=Paenibacillus larvae TaxID=1464 RepID=UPI0022825579|nr:DUF5693 family protein [Paenibacillus larvae]MCY9508980.1 DUF5693 family protein [Paenibacillus larvae]MCY9524632.1 DUF5693 family protein [Paenibacillus larvae]